MIPKYVPQWKIRSLMQLILKKSTQTTDTLIFNIQFQSEGKEKSII